MAKCPTYQGSLFAAVSSYANDSSHERHHNMTALVRRDEYDFSNAVPGTGSCQSRLDNDQAPQVQSKAVSLKGDATTPGPLLVTHCLRFAM